MSLLRLQLARAARRGSGRLLRGSADPRSGFRARGSGVPPGAARCDLFRRRHAEPVFRPRHRPLAGGDPRAVRDCAGPRDHAGGQSRHRRRAQLPRLPRRGREPAVPRRAELRREPARAAGFENLNLDLMYALPEQTPEQAAADLRAALDLAPEHLSYYQLTLEPNTVFAARPPPLPDEDSVWIMHQQGLALLAARGYAQYEVSAHARAGRQSRHNRNYWEFGDYLGIGAGAHAKRTRWPSPGLVRRARHKHPRTYVEHAGSAGAIQEERSVAVSERPFEYAKNALRLNEGFVRADFAARTGLA